MYKIKLIVSEYRKMCKRVKDDMVKLDVAEDILAQIQTMGSVKDDIMRVIMVRNDLFAMNYVYMHAFGNVWMQGKMAKQAAANMRRGEEIAHMARLIIIRMGANV